MGRLRRPIAPPAREAVLRRLSVEICRRHDELGAIDILERVDVEHRVARALDRAGHNRNCAARRTNVKIRGLCTEAVARHARLVGDAQVKPTVWVRGPGRAVLRAQRAAAGADRNRRSGFRPVECNANISAMTASVNAHGRSLYTLVCAAHAGARPARAILRVDFRGANHQRRRATDDDYGFMCAEINASLMRITRSERPSRPTLCAVTRAPSSIRCNSSASTSGPRNPVAGHPGVSRVRSAVLNSSMTRRAGWLFSGNSTAALTSAQPRSSALASRSAILAIQARNCASASPGWAAASRSQAASASLALSRRYSATSSSFEAKWR